MSTTHRRRRASAARTHPREALALFRRPFAPGAIGFRAMSKIALGGDPSAAPRSPPTSAPNRSCNA